MFTVDKDTVITPELMCEYIKIHSRSVERYEWLYSYYKGSHAILSRAKKRGASNNKVVCNYAKYISDIASGFLIGNPLSYTSETDIEPLKDALDNSESGVNDMDIAKMQSIYGVAYELDYLDEEGKVRLTTINPQNAFVVYDDTVNLKTIAGCYYYPYTDVKTQKVKGYHCIVMTATKQFEFKITTSFSVDGEVETKQNLFGRVNLIEIWNNNERQGDFEQIIPLINAYNTLQSDRVNDKEQFVDALLVLTGQTMGETGDEKSDTYRALKETGVVELVEGSKIEYLTRQFDESSVEVLRKSIEDDIHKFSCTPSMSDSNFGGNVSGVAMKFKMFGLEQMTKIKERYFTEGIKERLRLFKNIMEIKKSGTFDVDDVKITFTRSLPANELELSQIIANLTGIVSQETLVSQIPFVEDAAEEVQKSNEERKNQLKDEFVMTPQVVDGNENEPVLE